MRLDPAAQTVDVGNGPFNVSVLVDNVSNLGAYQFTVQFDPTVLRFVSVTDAGFLGSTQRPLDCTTPTLLYPAEDEPPNMIRYACGTIGGGSDPTRGPDGSGTVAVLTFAPVSSGYSDLILNTASVTDIRGASLNGEGQDAVTQNGSVTVTGDGPTATPDPNEPTAVPTAQYVRHIYVTATPGGSNLLTPEPGQTPLTRVIPGGSVGNPPPGALQIASDPAAVSHSSGASASSSNNGSPHAGTGPEKQKSSWPALAGGLLIALGAGLLFLSFYLKRIPVRSDDDSKR